MRRAPRQSGGFLLIIGLTVMAGLLALTGTGLTRSLTDLRVANSSALQAQALQLAEAGVDRAIWEFTKASDRFPENESWEDVSPGTAHADARCLAGQRCIRRTVALPGGEAAVTVLNATGLLTTIDVSASTAPGAAGSRSRRLLVTGNGNAPGFDYALFGADHLQLGTSGPITVDSFDSDLPPYAYDPGNPGDEGHIGTNDAADPAAPNGTDAAVDVDFISNALVHGTLYKTPLATTAPADPTNPDGNPLTNDARLDGEVVIASRLLLPSVAIPSSLSSLCAGGTEGDLVVSAGSGPPVSGAHCYNTITVQSTGQLTVAPDARVSAKALVVRNDGQVFLESGVQLYLRGEPGANQDTFRIMDLVDNGKVETRGSYAPGGEIKIYGGVGRFHVRTSQGLVNTAQCAHLLQVRLKGNTSSYATFTTHGNYLGQRPFYGALYIERGFLWLKGPWAGGAWQSGEHYGAFVSGGDLQAATHSASVFLKVHRDKAIHSIPLDEAPQPFRVFLWQDCSTDECAS